MTKWLNYVEEFIVVSSLIIMSVVAFGNVITRNFFGLSLSFNEEITVNLFVLLTFVGTSIGVRENAHLGFSLLFDKSPLTIKRIIILLVGILSILFFLIITYYGFKMVQYQLEVNKTTPALGWPQWLFSLGLPFGTLLCIIRSVEATLKEWKGLSLPQGGIK
ncbi:hypothetical protein GCM10009001_29230 [Virgibacillus siamensis]|uniref:Tripartite ATP-independent periplasmic transporters DctQ component domain-containing protein n=1 Tax=Virgibacillus siamensis TaxID=480071 RepID=A0ABN1GET6_9BACI